MPNPLLCIYIKYIGFGLVLFDGISIILAYLMPNPIYIYSKLATIVEGDPKAPFSIATTPRCRGGRYSIPRIYIYI